MESLEQQFIQALKKIDKLTSENNQLISENRELRQLLTHTESLQQSIEKYERDCREAQNSITLSKYPWYIVPLNTPKSRIEITRLRRWIEYRKTGG